MLSDFWLLWAFGYLRWWRNLRYFRPFPAATILDCVQASWAVGCQPCSSTDWSFAWVNSSWLNSSTTAWSLGASPRTCDQMLKCLQWWYLCSGSERSWCGWLGAHETRLGSPAVHWLVKNSGALLSQTQAVYCMNSLSEASTQIIFSL